MTRTRRFHPQAFALAAVCTLATFVSIERLAAPAAADPSLARAPATSTVEQQVVVIQAPRVAHS